MGYKTGVRGVYKYKYSGYGMKISYIGSIGLSCISWGRAGPRQGRKIGLESRARYVLCWVHRVE